MGRGRKRAQRRPYQGMDPSEIEHLGEEVARVRNAQRAGAGRFCARKARYDSKEAAQKEVERIARTRGELLRIYQCPFCSGWHLTHKLEVLS